MEKWARRAGGPLGSKEAFFVLRELLDIYLTCFRMGAVTFGGGMAMLPILRREVVEKLHWVEEEELIDFFALSEGLPGAIAINVCTFLGNRRRGTAGGVAAALGVVSPCLLVITLIAFILRGFQDNVYVRHALAGVSVCVAALILDAVMGMWKKAVVDPFGLILCVVSLGLSLFTTLSPILLVVSSALLGVAFKGRKGERT